jgi:hypothetical protein
VAVHPCLNKTIDGSITILFRKLYSLLLFILIVVTVNISKYRYIYISDKKYRLKEIEKQMR